MPRNARPGRRHSSPHDLNPPLSRDELEDRIQQAIASWKQNESPNLLSAAKKHGVAHKYSTLRRRAHGLAQSYSNAQRKQRLLTDAQEIGLVQRIQSLDCPITRDTICSFVNDVCGSYPSSNWVTRFRVRHPGIKLCRPPRNKPPVKMSNDLAGDQTTPSRDNPDVTVATDALAEPSRELSALLENSDYTSTSSDWDFSDISSISSISETSVLEFMAETTRCAPNKLAFPLARSGLHGLPFLPFSRSIEAPRYHPVRYATAPLVSHTSLSEDKTACLLAERIENLAKLQELELKRQTTAERVVVPQPMPSIFPAPVVISAVGPPLHPSLGDSPCQYAVMSDAAQRTAAWVYSQANQVPSHSPSVTRS